MLFRQFISPPSHLPLSRRLPWRDSSNSCSPTRSFPDTVNPVDRSADRQAALEAASTSAWSRPAGRLVAIPGRLDSCTVPTSVCARPTFSVASTPARSREPPAPAGLLSHVDRPRPGVSSSFRCSTVSPLPVVVVVVVVVVDVVAIAPVSFLSRAIARRYQMQPRIDEEPRLALAIALHIAVTRPACVCVRACLGF